MQFSIYDHDPVISNPSNEQKLPSISSLCSNTTFPSSVSQSVAEAEQTDLPLLPQLGSISSLHTSSVPYAISAPSSTGCVAPMCYSTSSVVPPLSFLFSTSSHFSVPASFSSLPPRNSAFFRVAPVADSTGSSIVMNSPIISNNNGTHPFQKMNSNSSLRDVSSFPVRMTIPSLSIPTSFHGAKNMVSSPPLLLPGLGNISAFAPTQRITLPPISSIIGDRPVLNQD